MLESNPKRSAKDSIRGYAYQLWQSIYSWIQLSDDEQLYLEAAEDIDKLSTTEVETTQVKDTPKSAITLRTKGVVEAINNFWELRSNNPTRKILFRYLTTSSCTVEDEAPLGSDGGIKVWNTVKIEDETTIEKIKAFLLSEKYSNGKFKFSESLRTFLSAASPSTIFRLLIAPFRWLYDQPDLAEIKTFVENFLVVHGDRLHVLPNDSKAAAAALLEKALDYAASSRHLALTKVNFLEIFESECFTLIQTSAVRDLFRPQQSNPSQLVAALIPDFYQFVPDITFIHFKRESVVTELLNRLAKTDFLLLNGLSGCGKTTLAKLVANRSNRNWLWVGLRGIRDEKTVMESLARVVAFAYRTPTVDCIIIDDLVVRANSAFAEQKIEELNYLIVHERKGKLMITSLDGFSPALRVRLNITDNNIYPVPSLSLNEIAELLTLFGQQDRKDGEILSRLIFAKTRGHVQLVYAYVASLKERNFDTAVHVLTTEQPAEVADLKKYALQTVAELYDQTTQNFIFKLTLVSGIFTKEQALRIAKHSPAVVNPGIVFDKITGAWIEPLGNPYYRISPLIEGTAHEIIDSKDIIELHRTIANAIFDSKSISLNEFSTAFFHSWEAQEEEALKRSALGALKETDRNFWKNLSEYIFWFSMVKMDQPFELYGGNPRVNNLLRAVQYKIAAHSNHKAAVKICNVMDKETELSGKTIDQESLMNRLQFIFIVVALSEPIKLSTAYLLKLIFELRALVEKYPEFEILNELSIIPDAISDGMGHSQTDIASLFLVIIPRCGSFKDLDEALELINNLPLSERAFLFKRVGSSDFLNDHWITLVVNNEAKSKTPDWNTSLEILGKWADKTFAWNLPMFTAAIVRGITHVNVEFLRRFDQALDACDRAPIQIRETFTVQNAKANVLYEKKDYKNATQIWRNILLPDHKSDNPFVVYSYRSAAIAEASLGQFRNAFNYLVKAYDLSQAIGHLKRPLGYKVDAAYCLWRLADFSSFLSVMHEVMKELETIPNDSNDVSNYSLHKMIGHCICWYMANKNEETGLFEPVVGVCSNPNVSDEVLKLIPTPIEYSWLNLISVERNLKISNRIFLEQYRRLDQCAYPLIRKQIRLFQLEQFFHSEPETIIELSTKATMERTMEQKVGRKLNMEIQLDDFELSAVDQESIRVNSFIFLCLHYLHEKDFDEVRMTKVVDALLERNASHQCVTLLEQLREFRNMIAQDGNFVMAVLQDGTKVNYIRILAAIVIYLRSDFGNEAVFYAHSIIFRFLSDKENVHISFEPVAEHVIAYWKNATNSPAFLKSPRTTVSPILDACNSSATGLPKIAAILLAAYEGVNLVVDDGTIDEWKRVLRS